MRRKLALLLAGLGLAVLWATPGQAVSENEACLSCHGEVEAVGSDLVIDPLTFDHTAHGELGCPACHASVTDTHPDDGMAPSKAGCRDCHQDVDEEFASSGHAGAATCGDCHNPHLVRGVTAVSGHDMNSKCGACHDFGEMASVHGTWLPQADLHLEMLPCISCHSGSENYVITLYLSRRHTDLGSGLPIRGRPFELAGYGELQALAGDREISSLIDEDGDGQISLRELKRFNSSRKFEELRLKGMLTPETFTHHMEILDNRWDCTFCHASGPDAMQTSFLALPRQNGTYGRLPVEKGAILDALYGTPDFYMLGATRNGTLDLIGLAILAGGLVMPVGHGTLRFLTRKNRR